MREPEVWWATFTRGPQFRFVNQPPRVGKSLGGSLTSSFGFQLDYTRAITQTSGSLKQTE